MRFPQYHWSAEIYSLGKCYRKIAKYPNFLPLFFTSDHGVNIVHDQNEVNLLNSFKSKLHFTWNNNRGIGSSYNWKTISITHPWVLYRRDMGIVRDEKPEGTIFYPAHTIPGFEVEGFNDLDSITYLRNLPDSYKPLSVSLHMHDLGSTREKLFKDAGFEIVSAGLSSSEQFIDNFYGILSRKKYVISESWGSQVAFSIELGIPVQIIPRNISILNKSSGLSPFEENYVVKQLEIEQEFIGIQNSVTSRQKELIYNLLGVNRRHSKACIRFRIWLSVLIPGLSWIFKKVISKLRLNNNSLS